MKAVIEVRLKKGILDPQGKAVNHALTNLGFDEIQDVRIGKLIEMELKASNRKEAEEMAEQACKKLLANPVIEEYTYDIIGEQS